MDIMKLPTNWRNKYKQAQFRWAIFFVEHDVRHGGRRVAPHEYPKRNVPYAEDMGRAANKFLVQGYLVGRYGGSSDDEVNYLTLKNNLIDCLEQDGPGMLRLPLPYRDSDVKVMVAGYAITESRETGGLCTIDMEFIEYGDPQYRATMATPSQIDAAATKVEDASTDNPPPDPTTVELPTMTVDEFSQAVAPYAQMYADATATVLLGQAGIGSTAVDATLPFGTASSGAGV